MFRQALIIFLTMLIYACGGSGSSDDINGAVDEAARVRQADIHLINTASESIDFFIRNEADTDTLFDSSNNVVSNNDKDVSEYTFQWNISDSVKTQIGAWDTNSQTLQTQLDSVVMNDTDKLWGIAWLDEGNGELMLTTLKRQASDLASKWRVRVLSPKDTQITNSNIDDLQTEGATKGVVTPYFTIDSCSSDLFIGAEAVDLCSLEIGKSYLLITDGDVLLVAAEEK